ncbi:MAG: bifunctional phosphopantothenoylcysteine decarboxylase/phosphopantothenate--cysteine ligase CoaBC, partial [Pseudobdellovibrio sp.]
MSNVNKNILIILTGSIACYKACSVISKLKQKGHHVKVVMSPSSLEFIGKASIEGLTGEPPITDMYSNGNVMDHINLARWAQLILVAPATANYINKIAYGMGDDLLTTLFLAHDFEKPFLIAPAMNTKMYMHPATQASIAKLRAMKVEILETASGVLACGEIGSGRLLEPDLIIEEVEKYLLITNSAKISSTPKASPTKLKVLITSGGTTEPIDDIRFITNKSSGTTAAALADSLIDSGIEVTYVHATNAVKTKNTSKQIAFDTFKDLQTALQTELKINFYDFVIHAAAVSDYSIDATAGKINSDQDEIQLTLKRNPKLINEIKKMSPKSKLFGFKLTSTTDKNLIAKKVESLFSLANCDLVIHNDWSDI